MPGLPKINILSPFVADLIAAGEVVERPASVVKELLENAVDAGARNVTLELRGGGREYIRVTDDGCGMSPEDAGIAFLRHATSKLSDARGLEAIGTLGFRGEALAAISSVSHIELSSCERGAGLGVRMKLDAGEISDMYETGCPEGTTMIVRGLFYNTPARLKFMKTDRAEGAACVQAALRCALGRPDVSFRCIRDGREEFFTPGDGRRDSAVYALLGRELAAAMLEVELEDGPFRVRGFVSEPALARGNRSAQYFFCNGRPIRSQLLQAALEQAYRGTMLTGRFPACVLYIELAPAAVDVNVHPAKTVVKFVSERAVFSAVHHGVKDALDGKAVPAPVPVQPLAGTVNPRGDFYQALDARAFRESRQEPAPAAPPPLFSGSELGGRVVLRDAVSPRPFRSDGGGAPAEPPLPFPQEPAAPPAAAQAPRAFSPPAGAAAEQPVEQPAEQLPIAPVQAVPWRLVGEVLHTYIVAEDGEDVYLIDKHAAHERINFDRMKASQEPVMRQQLLSSMAVELPQEQYAALLEEFGFEAEDFGKGCLMVRAIPSDIDTGLVGETLEMLAEQLLTCGSADPSAARDAMLHTMACKAAIKGGWRSDSAELQALLHKVQTGEVQFCPHGRPVKVKLSRHDLEKMFKRA